MQLGEQSWTEAKELIHKPVVIPTGALEQHGTHLPLLTDSIIGGEIARRAEAELGDEALFLPMLWLGASDHHLKFPGTVSVPQEVYIRILVGMIESLIAGGFRRIFLLNSHDGNITPAHAALLDVQLRYREEMPDLWLAFSSWFEIADEAIRKLASLGELKQTKVIHACEWETSMIQAARSELVKDARLATRFPYPSRFYVPDFSAGGKVYVARTIEQVSLTGSFGYPELASSEKGEALYKIATEEVVAFVREFANWELIAPQ